MPSDMTIAEQATRESFGQKRRHKHGITNHEQVAVAQASAERVDKNGLTAS